MAYVDLDKIINITWGGWVYPSGDDPAPYPVLTQSIGIFNKPNAWDVDSNWRFGLLNNSNNAINAQNNNRNTQMAIAVDSGVGVLSTHVKSFDFSTNIAQIDSGQIKWSLFKNTTSYNNIITLNNITNKISNVMQSQANITVNNAGNSRSADSYIITSGGNRFLIYKWNVYPIDVNNNITWSATWTILWDVVGVVWNTIWSVWNDILWNDVVWYIYTIDNLWVSTLINSVILSGVDWGSHGKWYQVDNTISHCLYLSAWIAIYTYITIDLTQTLTFTYTSVFSGNFAWDIMGYNVWYDGVWLLMSYRNGFNRSTRRVTGWGLANLWSSHAHYYTNKTNNILYFQDDDTTVRGVDNLSIYSNIISWPDVGTLYDSMSFIYELNGSEKDNCFVGVMFNNSIIAYWENNQITFMLNWVDIFQYDHDSCLLSQWSFTQILSLQILTDNYIDIEMTSNNPSDLKIWFGITGWTYATPTLPVNNGMSSGSATTPWVPGGSASYINLTLSVN